MSISNGSVTVNAEPSPSTLSTVMAPFIFSMSSFTIDIPRPVPSYCVRAPCFSCVNGSKSSLFTKFSLIPMPVSRIVKRNVAVFSSQAISSAYVSIVPFSLLYFAALLNRFNKICRRCSGLPISFACVNEVLLQVYTILVFATCTSVSARTSFITSSRSNGTCSGSIWPDSSLLIFKTSLMSDSRCSEETWIFSRQSSTRS